MVLYLPLPSPPPAATGITYFLWAYFFWGRGERGSTIGVFPKRSGGAGWETEGKLHVFSGQKKTLWTGIAPENFGGGAWRNIVNGTYYSCVQNDTHHTHVICKIHIFSCWWGAASPHSNVSIWNTISVTGFPYCPATSLLELRCLLFIWGHLSEMLMFICQQYL